MLPFLTTTLSGLLQCIQMKNLFAGILPEYFGNGAVLLYSSSPIDCLPLSNLLMYTENDTNIHMRKSHPYLARPNNSILIISEQDLPRLNLTLVDHILWNPRSRTFVFVDSVCEARRWLEMLWKATKAFNVVAVVSNQFFTWFPYQRNECSRVETLISLSVDNLFPEKIVGTFRNCTVFVTSSRLPPWVIENESKELIGGVDFNIFKILQERYHFQPTYVEPKDSFFDTWGTDGQLGGGLRLVHSQEVDLIYGQVSRTWDHGIYSDMLTSHIEDDLTWFVAPPKFIPSVNNLNLAFPLNTWIYVITSFLLIIIFALIGLLKSPKVNFLVYYKGFLSLPLDTPLDWYSRVTITLTVILGLHVTTLYQTALMKLLSTHPMEKAIDTAEEAVDRGLIFNFYEGQRFLITQSNSSLWQKIEENNLSRFYISVPIINLTDRDTFLGPRQTFSVHVALVLKMIDKDGHVMFEPFPGKFQSIPLIFSMAPGHPFRDLFDCTIQHLIEGGFPWQWLKDALDKDIRKYDRVTVRTIRAFTIDNLSGAFVFLGLCLLASFVIFLFEICSSMVNLYRKRRLA